MKVLITGIAGFIGFHTALELKKQGHSVIGFDNFNDYYDVNLKHERARILESNQIDVRLVDLKIERDVDNLIKEVEPELVIHLAAIAGVRYSMDHPREYIDTNITGTLNLIESCERNSVENVVYASTSCVMHGNSLPWAESDTFQLQLNPYGYSKYINESQFHISKIKNAVGLRFFTVYGPYGRPDMALFDFTKNILANKAITVYNYGDMKRDFTYVDDIVQAIILVSNNMTNRDIYCVGYGEQVELLHFIGQIEKNLDKTAIKIFADKHPADAKETWSDTTKLKSLGFESKTSIEEGVKKFVQWYTEYYA